jgi:repressor LexA
MTAKSSDDGGKHMARKQGKDVSVSDNQMRIYDFIVKYVAREGQSPTNREIGQAVGISSTGHIDYHLAALERRGLIDRRAHKSRGIQLTQSAPRGLVIEGTIAAGEPLEIFPASEERERVDLAQHTEEYVLRVRGDSMIEDHITSGDFVLVQRETTILDGDIIVATKLNSDSESGAATLKRIYKEANGVRLQPANSAMKPIHISKHEWDANWQVQGKVTAVYRAC